MGDKSGATGAIHILAALLTPEIPGCVPGLRLARERTGAAADVERMVAMRSEGRCVWRTCRGRCRVTWRRTDCIGLWSGAYSLESRHGPSSPVVPLPETKKPETLKALAATGRQMTKAAQMLGISRMTLYRRMGEYGL